MPVYVYACRDCGHQFEARQGIREEPLKTCPQCGSPVRRVIQPVGIVFKGSGFYKTDSRSSTEASVPAGERKAEATANGSTPEKPATESTAKPAESAPASAPAAATTADKATPSS